MKQKVNDELKQHFRPEFLNRIDDIIVFHQLTEEEIVEIVDLMSARLEGQLSNKDMGLELTADAKALLAKKGYDPVLGARPLRRTIQREIEDTLSEKILFSELGPGPDRRRRHRAVDLLKKDGEQRFSFRGEPKPSALALDVPPAGISAD